MPGYCLFTAMADIWVFGRDDRRSVTNPQRLEAKHQCLADETRLAQRKQMNGRIKTHIVFSELLVKSKQKDYTEIRAVCNNNSILHCIKKPQIKIVPSTGGGDDVGWEEVRRLIQQLPAGPISWGVTFLTLTTLIYTCTSYIFYFLQLPCAYWFFRSC